MSGENKLSMLKSKMVRSKRIRVEIAVVFLTIIFFVILILYGEKSGGLLKATCLDVGEGDAIFITFPWGGNMLVDGGEGGQWDRGEKVVLPALRYWGVSKIDLLILTHPHSDHLGGLIKVLENIPVRMVIDSGQMHTSYSYEKFLSLIDEKNIPYTVVKSGDEITGYRGVKIMVVNPPHPFFQGTDSDLNNNSIVLRIVYREVSLLLTGDIERETERRILSLGETIHSNFLKVPHHGSGTSSSWEFLKLVSPQVAVISVGRRNNYGHPAPIVLERYEELNCQLFRTDNHGAVTFITDGRIYWVKSYKE